MNLLALDTSTEYCSAALLRGPGHGAPASSRFELAYRECHAGQRHSELILPMVGELLAEAGLAPMQLDGVAFGAGPGSFTGVRIACGVAQGLAFGADAPVMPVGTLVALAEESGAARSLACIDARMNELYFAAYRRDGAAWTEVLAPAVGSADAIPALDGDGWFGCGSGFAAQGEALARRFGDRLAGVDASLHPHARAIARLAYPVLLAGGGVPAEQAAPLYVRDRVALKMNER